MANLLLAMYRGMSPRVDSIIIGTPDEPLIITSTVTDTGMYYIHTYHLGSYCAITNQSQQVVQRNYFDPWGNLITGIGATGFTLTSRGFTGHEQYPELKIINMNGRLYDPVIGRFFSPDKYVANSSFTQDFNRYTYARNNPLMYTDPDGEMTYEYYLTSNRYVQIDKYGGEDFQYINFYSGFGSLCKGAYLGSYCIPTPSTNIDWKRVASIYNSSGYNPNNSYNNPNRAFQYYDSSFETYANYVWKEYKNTFNVVARENGFEKAFGGWFKENQECILVLDLQKSNYGDYYEMNVKIFVQGTFGNHYVKSKDLVKKDVGNIFTRHPKELRDVLVFDDVQMTDEERIFNTKKLFNEFIIPFANKALSRSGIKELAEQGKIFLLPAVKDELYK